MICNYIFIKIYSSNNDTMSPPHQPETDIPLDIRYNNVQEDDNDQKDQPTQSNNPCSSWCAKRSTIVFLRVATVVIIAFVVCEIIVNIKLPSKEKQCRLRKYIDTKVNATLYIDKTWYIFQYEMLICDAPLDESLVGRENGTSITIYISHDLTRCSYPKPFRKGCDAILTFNVVFPFIICIFLYALYVIISICYESHCCNS